MSKDDDNLLKDDDNSSGGEVVDMITSGVGGGEGVVLLLRFSVEEDADEDAAVMRGKSPHPKQKEPASSLSLALRISG